MNKLREAIPQTGQDDKAVRLTFDWAPLVVDGRITLKTSVRRGAQSSSLDFEVDLLQMSPDELEQLRDFLSRRHAGQMPAAEVAKTIAWLVDCSLRQAQPQLSPEQREVQVRERLLVGTTAPLTLISSP